MKKTYKHRLPKDRNLKVKNCKASIVNNEVVIEVEYQDNFCPKRGDYLRVINPLVGATFIFKELRKGADNKDVITSFCTYFADGKWHLNGDDSLGYLEGVRYATKKEIEEFNKCLAEVHYLKWNPEKECMESTRWRANKGEKYWYVDNTGNVYSLRERNDRTDEAYYQYGNYFKTEEEAQEKANEIKYIFKHHSIKYI